MNALTYILISLAFSAFFSGMEIAFISSNKLRHELDKKNKNIAGKILDIFYRNPNQFISTMLVGNNIALVVYGLQMAIVLEPFIARFVDNEALIVLIQSIISTLLILFTGEFQIESKLFFEFVFGSFVDHIHYIISYLEVFGTDFLSDTEIGGCKEYYSIEQAYFR